MIESQLAKILAVFVVHIHHSDDDHDDNLAFRTYDLISTFYLMMIVDDVHMNEMVFVFVVVVVHMVT